MTTNLSIPNEIARQIGGQAFLMMGTRHKTASDSQTLTFDIRGSKKVNWVKIKLDLGTDTYEVSFLKITPSKGINIVYKTSDIYSDQLLDLIENHTGLYLSLRPRR